MTNEVKAGHQLEAAVLTLLVVAIAAGFALGWVGYYWVHR